MPDSEKTSLAEASESKNKSEAKAGRPNWVEVATLMAVIAGTGWQYLFYGHQRDKLELREAAVRVNEAESQVVSIAAQILPPETHIVRDDVTLSVCPLVVGITNNGRLPVQIDDVRLRIYSTTLEKVAKLQQPSKFGNENQKVVLASGVQPSPPNNGIGVIDLKSDNWVEVLSHTHDTSPQSRTISRGQSRQVTFHLLVPHTADQRDFNDQVQRVVVTVSPGKDEHWSPQSWFGFVDHSFCAPVAFPPDITADESASAPRAFLPR